MIMSRVYSVKWVSSFLRAIKVIMEVKTNISNQ